jgi:proteasome lid subunit RPN8/RPN11
MQRVLNIIVNHANSYAPRECCGFICQKGNGLLVFGARNTADDPVRNFRIDPTFFLKVKKKHLIRWVYHSHTLGNEKMSEKDKKSSIISGIPFLCYSIETGQFSYFCPENSVFL